jgi:hypothetical protein
MKEQQVAHGTQQVAKDPGSAAEEHLDAAVAPSSERVPVAVNADAWKALGLRVFVIAMVNALVCRSHPY